MEAQLIKVMPAVIAVLCMLLIVLIASKYHLKDSIVKRYERVHNTLKEKKTGIFSYEKANAFLTANGATYSMGKWINPISYYGLNLATAAVFVYMGIRFHWICALLGAVTGFYLPGLLIRYCNRKSNVKMLLQIRTLYNALETQTKAGVYITNALVESYKRLNSGRLRDALEIMAGELLVKNSFEEAVRNFNSKFNNEFIDTLCVIITQCKETGKSIDMLNDINEQIADMNVMLLQKRKEKLERRGTLLILGVIVLAVVLITYVMLTTLLKLGIQII